MRFLLSLYGLVILVVIADAITKKIALEVLFSPPQIIEVLPFFNLVPVWNPGISFGFLNQGGELTSWLLVGFAVAVGGFLPFYARHWEKWGRLGAKLMAGGAFGNALDRVLYGKVVDFLDLHVAGWHWPAFNLADIAITCGAGLILLAHLVKNKRAG